MIFRAATYAILSASAPCAACGHWTHVVALALPPEHEVFAGDAWGSGPSAACLFHVESVPGPVYQRLERLAPWYRRSGPCWLNHCEHCDSPYDDHDLHCEPDGAFASSLAATETAPEAGAAARIVRWEVSEPLEVVAGGCGEDPSV